MSCSGAEPAADAAAGVVRHRDQRDEGDQQRADVGGEPQAADRALGGGVEHVHRRALDRRRAPPERVSGSSGLGHHQLRDQDPRRRREQARRREVSREVAAAEHRRRTRPAPSRRRSTCRPSSGRRARSASCARGRGARPARTRSCRGRRSPPPPRSRRRRCRACAPSAAAQQVHHALHHAEVVEHREDAAHEDDHREHVQGEGEARVERASRRRSARPRRCRRRAPTPARSCRRRRRVPTGVSSSRSAEPELERRGPSRPRARARAGDPSESAQATPSITNRPAAETARRPASLTRPPRARQAATSARVAASGSARARHGGDHREARGAGRAHARGVRRRRSRRSRPPAAGARARTTAASCASPRAPPRRVLRARAEDRPEGDVVDRLARARPTPARACASSGRAAAARAPRAGRARAAGRPGRDARRRRPRRAPGRSGRSRGRARPARAVERADLRGPGEQLAVARVLGAQLHGGGAAGAGRARLLDGREPPARRVVGEHVQTGEATRRRAPRQRRPGRAMPSSTIFLRSVLRLMPRMAAARIWLPSVCASTASSSGCSTRSRILR